MPCNILTIKPKFISKILIVVNDIKYPRTDTPVETFSTCSFATFIFAKIPDISKK